MLGLTACCSVAELLVEALSSRLRKKLVGEAPVVVSVTMMLSRAQDLAERTQS